MTRGGITLALVASLALASCDAEPPPAEPEKTTSLALADVASRGERTRLGVPPRQIQRARREAVGLLRMPAGLRAQTLEERRAEHTVGYAALRTDADGHAREGVSFEGRVGLVRSAGRDLWIMALHTRREGERWLDPLYVLSVFPPQLPADGGATARVDGWVVGERTIGRHALPLIVAYHVERTDRPSEAEPPTIRAVH